jgi:tellurite resistance protein TehA-like permease
MRHRCCDGHHPRRNEFRAAGSYRRTSIGMRQRSCPTRDQQTKEAITMRRRRGRVPLKTALPALGISMSVCLLATIPDNCNITYATIAIAWLGLLATCVFTTRQQSRMQLIAKDSFSVRDLLTIGLTVAAVFAGIEIADRLLIDTLAYQIALTHIGIAALIVIIQSLFTAKRQPVRS